MWVGLNLFSEAQTDRMEENIVNICVRVESEKKKTRTIRIAFETPVMIKHSQCVE